MKQFSFPGTQEPCLPNCNEVTLQWKEVGQLKYSIPTEGEVLQCGDVAQYGSPYGNAVCLVTRDTKWHQRLEIRYFKKSLPPGTPARLIIAHVSPKSVRPVKDKEAGESWLKEFKARVSEECKKGLTVLETVQRGDNKRKVDCLSPNDLVDGVLFEDLSWIFSED